MKALQAQLLDHVAHLTTPEGLKEPEILQYRAGLLHLFRPSDSNAPAVRAAAAHFLDPKKALVVQVQPLKGQ